MRIVLQRVSSAAVRVDGREVARIGRGMVLLAGAARGDGPAAAEALGRKVAGLRIFKDAEGRMSLDLRQVGGEILLVSQFTLAGSLERGRRPSFDGAAPAEEARPLLERLAAVLAAAGLTVRQGVFGARMEVELVNEGPVTFVLEG